MVKLILVHHMHTIKLYHAILAWMIGTHTYRRTSEKGAVCVCGGGAARAFCSHSPSLVATIHVPPPSPPPRPFLRSSPICFAHVKIYS